MSSAWETFRNCGGASWLILLFSLLGIVISAVAALLSLLKVRTAAIVVSIIGLLVALSSLASGPMGMWNGQIKVERALAGPGIAPDLKQRIREQGDAEALGCLPVAGTLGSPALVVAIGAVALAVLRGRNRTT